MQFYRATRIINGRIDLTGYCGIHAENLEHAERGLEIQLRRKGRNFYFSEWEASGRPIIIAMGLNLAPYDLRFVGDERGRLGEL